MKVLFAVNNENISNLIVKKYQKEYKEIISSKNVYYFNAILKEIQRDKSYDRIIISEDLEQFSNSNYQQMDKFIFDRLDSISDEASNINGEDIPIILICSERRAKGEEILVKLFGIGIYNAIMGKDRDINEVCNLINKPRSKKEAKEYYKIDTDDVKYEAENENDVSEIEIQNILAHYKRLGKNEERYIESFDNIALQYNDIQLKIICKFLPLNVRAVLEEKSPKYQKLMAFNKSVSEALKEKEIKKTETVGKLLITPTSKPALTKPVVIPTTVKSGEVKKLTKKEQIKAKIEEPAKQKNEQPVLDDILEEITPTHSEPEIVKDIIPEEVEQATAKRGRGRPKKITEQEEPVKMEEDIIKETVEEVPVEEVAVEEMQEPPTKKGRGRPKKVVQEVATKQQGTNADEENILPELDEWDQFIKDNTNQNNTEGILPGYEDIIEDTDIVTEKEPILPGFEDDTNTQTENTSSILPSFNIEGETETKEIEEENPFASILKNEEPKKAMTVSDTREYSNFDVSGLLGRNNKIVSFVGTSKNGTSFVLNNLAELLSSKGINVAILDTTQNRNSYYIYTKSQENLRRTAFESIKNLTLGNAKGIAVNNNLTVYTSLPSKSDEIYKVGPILETLLKNHSLILIDCDFETPLDYFANAQEIYLVQSLDVLTIQPLTAFLRELKAKNILEESKLRIVINKYLKLRSVTEKAIIGGMAFYNDPAMSYMTELFDRNTIRYITIPFEEEIYTKYLDGLINCDISLKGYSKRFMQILEQLGNSVYPLISGKSKYNTKSSQYQGNFSADINNTLNQMKRNY